ncbi:HtaA domain-containing protein [Nocardiopsis lucentensis]|uniref:HtaA domain-containing protein n=1 Tax=Nocardiopsis lucentensis TaxID=53441 RepID=UPI00034878A3|nr:HtaA domain-containing protein [Nocardiopsis lucentensis]
MITTPSNGTRAPGRTRRLLRSLTAATGATVVGGTLALAPVQSASAEETVTVEGGSAAWGVKESFRDYVSGFIAQGGYEGSDGATVLADGTVDFPTVGGEVSKEDSSGHVDFGGTVAFTGHDYGNGPVLEIRLSDPRVEFDGDGSALVLADVESRPFEGVQQTTPAPLEDFGQVPVAELSGVELSVEEEDLTLTSTAGGLRADAVPAFANFYTAGTAMDPLAFTTTLQAGEEPVPHDPRVTVTPSTALDPEGDVVTVEGTGFRPGAGIYVALTGVPRSPDSHPRHWYGDGVWLRDAAAPAEDGTFSTELDVVGAFDKDGTSYDCAEEQCYVAVFNDRHDLDNRDQDVWVPVAFAADDDGDGDGETPGGPSTVHSGRADWGVRESFRTYIEGDIAQGSISTEDGAARNDDGTFAFSGGEGEVDLAAATADLDFEGTVLFEGHAYEEGDPLLHMTVTDPRVVIDGASGVLYADVVSKSLDDEELIAYDDVAFADLDLSGVEYTLAEDVLTWDAIPAALTAEGVPAFADFYAEGEELDPVTLTVGVSEDADVPGGDTGGDGDDGGGGDGDGDGGDDGGGDGDGKPGLPNTGVALTGLLVAAVVAIGAGGAAMVASRGRAPAEATTESEG